VLLLSATPIHNRRADLVALLSLFLGSRARSMTSAELGLCIVRREHAQLEGTLTIPAIAPAKHHHLSDSARVVDELMNLPPPLPVRDGGLGGVLIGRGLVHQWASSEAALREAVNRRIARATALSASLEGGTYPTARELETWTYGEGALQLGFPELLSAPILGHTELLEAVREHLKPCESFAPGLLPQARWTLSAPKSLRISGARIWVQRSSPSLSTLRQYRCCFAEWRLRGALRCSRLMARESPEAHSHDMKRSAGLLRSPATFIRRRRPKRLICYLLRTF
jgi:hypothetical protein